MIEFHEWYLFNLSIESNVALLFGRTFKKGESKSYMAWNIENFLIISLLINCFIEVEKKMHNFS